MKRLNNAKGIIKKNLFHLRVLPVLVVTSYIDLKLINGVSEINAAVVNISGRQRMLSQRTAMMALRLACTQDKTEQEKLRSCLVVDLDLMERSHNGLIYGDLDMELPGNPSPIVKAMYFEPPIHLDRQVRQYISEARIWAQAEGEELSLNNPHLQYMLAGAAKDLLEALDAVVNQYQKESEAERIAIQIHQAELYQQSCADRAAAEAQTRMLEAALQELQQAQAQLLQTEKMSSLGHLVAGIAHEINNPINFIYGNLNYANDYIEDLLRLLEVYREQIPYTNSAIQAEIEAIDLDFVKEDLPKVLSSMKMGADRICQIVRSLRNFSRTDEEAMQLVNLHEGIDGTLLILQHRLKANGKSQGIKVIKEYGDLPLVECYPGQMNQVFMNLLSNAIDALEEGSREEPSSLPATRDPEPTIRICTEISRPNIISVRIADNGPGMTAEVKTRLFESFFTTKPVGKGTGLGLPISRQIVVEKHGGSLECISQVGQGTEFLIEIPQLQSEELAAKESTAVAVT